MSFCTQPRLYHFRFRFDEDSDTDFYQRRGKRPVVTDQSYTDTPIQAYTDTSVSLRHNSPLTPRPHSDFINHVPDYTDDAMNYLEAEQDLSPIRASDHTFTPTSQNTSAQAGYVNMSSNSRTSDQQPFNSKFYPTHRNHPGDYHSGDSVFPTGYAKSDYNTSDHNSNLLARSPNKDIIPDKNLEPIDTRDHYNNTDNSSQSFLDVSKSVSSGDSRAGGGDYSGNNSRATNNNNSHYYSDRAVQSYHPQSLKRAREQNLRDNSNTRYRSTSLGECISSPRNTSNREVAKPRTPSAPGELNQSSRSSYYGRNNDFSHLQSPTERSILSDKSRSVLYNTSVQGRQSRIDQMVNGGSLTRSVLSGEYRVRDHDKSIVSTTTTNNGNSLNRIVHKQSDVIDSSDGGGKDTSLTHRNKPFTKSTPLQPNGVAKLIRDSNTNLDQSKQGLNLSKFSVTNGHQQHRQVITCSRDYGVVNSLVSLAFMAFLSLVIVFMSIQLLFHLNSRTAVGLPPNANSVLTNSTYGNVLEVTIALTTFVMMLDLCCLLVCSMQCFFAAKLVKCSQGEER